MDYLTDADVTKTNEYIETVTAVLDALLAPIPAKGIAKILELVVDHEPDKLNDLYDEISKLPSFQSWFTSPKSIS